MIEKYLYANWEEPHYELEFEQPFGEIMQNVRASLESVLERLSDGEPTKDEWRFYADILNIYIKTQAFTRLILNYKIAVEFGLPLHPTTYFEFDKEPKDAEKYPADMRSQAIALFLDSIDVSRRIYALSPEALDRLDELRRTTPDMLKDFVYTNRRDKYTWMASDPKHVKSLADQVKEKAGDIGVIIGAAHGCIRPGILLANMLGSDLYFLRFSLFKRHDQEPVISEHDKEFFARHRDRKAVLFDEDIAKGETMQTFERTVKPFFRESHTASVIRHHLAPFRPDFVGYTFIDYA
ncbi:MAG: phosphoribosyltransferase [Nanoarchaeota archaeon]|nr:phosphoribosyltransferase [Nanoarchaeota archaeon]